MKHDVAWSSIGSGLIDMRRCVALQAGVEQRQAGRGDAGIGAQCSVLGDEGSACIEGGRHLCERARAPKVGYLISCGSLISRGANFWEAAYAAPLRSFDIVAMSLDTVPREDRVGELFAEVA